MVCLLNCSSFCFVLRCCTSSRANLSSETQLNVSPPDGTSSKPVISTGTDGPASFTLLPLSFVIALTLPTQVPATIISPVLNVPFCTSIVATGPRPLSSFASITVPLAALAGFAFKSFISAINRIISKTSSIPSFLAADTGIQGISPPHSSGTSSCSVNCCFTKSGFAPSLSILFIATIIETPAALAWLIASIVCGIIPSSAATTKTAISVTWAPLALIVVKASCPGVSRNVISLPSKFTL